MIEWNARNMRETKNVDGKISNLCARHSKYDVEKMVIDDGALDE